MLNTKLTLPQVNLIDLEFEFLPIATNWPSVFHPANGDPIVCFSLGPASMLTAGEGFAADLRRKFRINVAGIHQQDGTIRWNVGPLDKLCFGEGFFEKLIVCKVPMGDGRYATRSSSRVVDFLLKMCL